MSSEKRNNIQDVILIDDDAASPTLVDAVPLAVAAPPAVILDLENGARRQQTPPLNGSGGDKTEKQDRGKSVQQEVGSSSAAPRKPSPEMAPIEAVPLAVAAPAILPGPQLQLAGKSSNTVVIKGLMQHCVGALLTANYPMANKMLEAISRLVSLDGDAVQRVAFAFAEALGRRTLMPLPGVAWALHLQLPRSPAPALTEAARGSFYKIFPLFQVAATAANHAIAEAVDGERHVHLVDLGGAKTDQWRELLRLLAARPGGPPSAVRLSVVSENEDFLSHSAGILTEEAMRLRVNFVFNPVRSHIDRLSPTHIAAFGVEPGQAVAITATLQLHRLIADVVNIQLPAATAEAQADRKGKGKMPAEQTAGPSTTTCPHAITKADALLRVLRDMSPKVVVLTEQEADHNGAIVWHRIRSAFDYYVALFADMEAGGASGQAAERVAVERVLLRDEIMDIVAREGAARRERHEAMKRWAPRMAKAGFVPAQVNFEAFVATARMAHQLSGDGKRRLYRAIKENGCFFIYSQMTPIFSVSAWQPSKRAGE
ncbi:hypothetical protein ACP70R_035274 [Stipagrostis hirtigluma subsp. patula]